MLGRGMLGAAEGGPWGKFDGIAEALELTPGELFAQLHDGKTLAEIAEAQGIDLEAVQEQMAAQVAAERAEAMRNAIAQAVADGEMSTEQSEWLLEGLDKGYMPGRGIGGRGFGGHGFGPRRGPCPLTDADAGILDSTSA
jgi:hypothetical protein